MSQALAWSPANQGKTDSRSCSCLWSGSHSSQAWACGSDACSRASTHSWSYRAPWAVATPLCPDPQLPGGDIGLTPLSLGFSFLLLPGSLVLEVRSGGARRPPVRPPGSCPGSISQQGWTDRAYTASGSLHSDLAHGPSKCGEGVGQRAECFWNRPRGCGLHGVRPDVLAGQQRGWSLDHLGLQTRSQPLSLSNYRPIRHLSECSNTALCGI